jgi:hypothetical protein
VLLILISISNINARRAAYEKDVVLPEELPCSDLKNESGQNVKRRKCMGNFCLPGKLFPEIDLGPEHHSKGLA